MIGRFLPEHETEVAVEFLKSFQPEGPWHLVSMKPDGKPHFKTIVDAEDLGPWIEEQQGEENVYFSVNRAHPSLSHAKAKKDDIVSILALHVDIDNGSVGTLDLLKAHVPRPSVIVQSGGGYHGYWLLQEPTHDLVRAERCNIHLEKALGGDHCHNVDRIMRLPGTINLPNAKKRAAGREPALATIIEVDWSLRYTLDDFTASAPGPAGPKGAVAALAQVTPVDLDALPASVDLNTRGVIRIGDDPERPRGSEAPRFPSRSEAVFSVACALARAGCTDETIAGVLINQAFGIAESVLEKGKPVPYALKQARSARQAVENGWPDTTKAGVPRPTMRNAMVALRRLGLVCSYDLFRHRKRIDGNALDKHQGDISDNTIMVLRTAIIDAFGFDPRSDHVRDAVSALCLENATHPILQMLDGLHWDGIPRLDQWLSTYMGAVDSPYVRAVGSITLIAAVRRVRDPGVKFDQIIVFEGKQGSGKSTALQILAGPGNHSDQEILTVDAKQQIELMEGVWIYELGEIAGLSKADVAKTKAFASRLVDQSRMAYGYFKETRPRQCIFIGTTNEDHYLRDQSGNRRFWPIKTDAIDLEALRRDRDQLWAEAAEREAAGEAISLSEELWAAAAAEQAQRMEEDPWLEILARIRGQAAGDMVRVSTTDIFAEFLKIPLEKRYSSHLKHVATLMKSLGWGATKWRVGRDTIRGYQRPKPDDHEDDVRAVLGG